MRRATPLGWLALVALLASACSIAPGPAPAPLPAAGAGDDPSWRYALMIDASSSASTLQIFRWRRPDDGRLPIVEAVFDPDSGEAWESRVEPGIAAYSGKPQEAAASLEPLVDFATSKLGGGSAPPAGTSLYLRATAGMRLLDAEQQKKILAAVRSYLRSTPFDPATAEVVSGEDEGVFGWITVNYLLGHLDHGGLFPTVGALDLGGASAQITFQPLDFPRDHAREVALGGKRYRLFTRSYLGLGQDVARERVGSPDCFPAGYPIPALAAMPAIPAGTEGRGDFDACGRAIRRELAVACSEDEKPCPLLEGTTPPLYGDFVALSVYAYTADYFELDERLRPSEIAAAGRELCARDWNAWVAREPAIAGNPYAPLYCYASAHIEALLADGFGFPADTERITAPLRIQGAPIGWTLGALVYELAGG